MDIERIAVVGAGVMGHGIAQVAATAGFRVHLYDNNGHALADGLENIKRSLAKRVEHGHLDITDSSAALERLQATTSLSDALRGADFVIEAATEMLETKRQILGAIDELAPAQALITSNTSQYSITLLGSLSRNPSRVCGMHFFNPPVLMGLVEIVRGMKTADDTYDTVVAVSRRMGKETVTCKDSQGFITSRLIAALILEATRVVEEGLATPEDVDKACRLGLGHSMGPLETADWSGLDTVLRVSEELTHAFGDRFRPPQTLRNLVQAGHKGRKTGHGIHVYRSAGTVV